MKISPGYSLEGLMLKLKLQYFGYLMLRTDSLEKTLILEKGWQRMRQLDGISDLMDMSLSKLRELVIDREAQRAAVHGVAKSETRLSSRSVVSKSLWPHRLQPARLLCPWNSPGKNTEMGYHFLLQGIFLTQELNPCLLHWQADSLPLSQLGSPIIYWVRT